MSSGWPIRKLLLTRTHMDLLFLALALSLVLFFTSSASFTSPEIPCSADFTSFNLSLQFSFILPSTLYFKLTTASLSSLYFSEIWLLEWKPFECIWISLEYYFSFLTLNFQLRYGVSWSRAMPYLEPLKAWPDSLQAVQRYWCRPLSCRNLDRKGCMCLTLLALWPIYVSLALSLGDKRPRWQWILIRGLSKTRFSYSRGFC